MPFVPRSHLQQQQQAQPPQLAVVEHSPPSGSGLAASQGFNGSTEDQISELNELLVHVLDEISNIKEALYDNVRKMNNTTPPRKKIMSDSEHETEEEDEKPKHNRSKRPVQQSKGLDFSACF